MIVSKGLAAKVALEWTEPVVGLQAEASARAKALRWRGRHAGGQMSAW